MLAIRNSIYHEMVLTIPGPGVVTVETQKVWWYITGDRKRDWEKEANHEDGLDWAG